MQIFIIVISFFCLELQAFSEVKNIEIKIGEKKIVSSLQDLLLPQNKIIKVKDLGQSYEIQGLKSGFVQAQMGSVVLNISVLRQKQSETLLHLKNYTQKHLGLKAQVLNGRVQLKGRLVNTQDWFDIAKACEQIDCDYEARFEVSQSLRLPLQKKLSEHMHGLGLNSYPIRWAPDLHIVIPEKTEAQESIILFANKFGIRTLKQKFSFELEPSIEVKILIAEVKKNHRDFLGVQWPESYSAQILPTTTGLTENAILSVKALSNSGLGKVLASPSLICRSGKEAEFLAGGEIPIKIISQKMADVIWKKYGIILRLKPIADFSGRMSLSVETEISKIDAAHSVDGIPGFETSRVQSHFDLLDSQVIAISGLLRMDQGEAEQGLPYLSKIPILGRLFSSQEFQRQETELIIFVQPKVIQPN